MSLNLPSPCKVNLLLNILGRRSDGFHELETVLQPVPLFDYLQFEEGNPGVELTCTLPGLPVDATNLVHRAATVFLEASAVKAGVRIHLEKNIPLAAGLGGGSGNAATTLLGLNRLFGHPLPPERLNALAAGLGSDVPFFLRSEPALATGRGESVTPLESFPALRGVSILLIHPGFGIPTAWAYQQLGRFPDALNGAPGRAARLIERLQANDLAGAAGEFYNALEAPVLEKYPILALYQQFLRDQGVAATLMSGSGSTTFALVRSAEEAEGARKNFLAKFGDTCWTAVVTL